MLGFQVQEGIKDMEGANANILTHLGPMYSHLLSPTPLPGHRRADITQTYVGGGRRGCWHYGVCVMDRSVQKASCWLTMRLGVIWT